MICHLRRSITLSWSSDRCRPTTAWSCCISSQIQSICTSLSSTITNSIRWRPPPSCHHSYHRWVPLPSWLPRLKTKTQFHVQVMMTWFQLINTKKLPTNKTNIPSLPTVSSKSLPTSASTTPVLCKSHTCTKRTSEFPRTWIFITCQGSNWDLRDNTKRKRTHHQSARTRARGLPAAGTCAQTRLSENQSSASQSSTSAATSKCIRESTLASVHTNASFVRNNSPPSEIAMITSEDMSSSSLIIVPSQIATSNTIASINWRDTSSASIRIITPWTSVARRFKTSCQCSLSPTKFHQWKPLMLIIPTSFNRTVFVSERLFMILQCWARSSNSLPQPPLHKSAPHVRSRAVNKCKIRGQM